MNENNYKSLGDERKRLQEEGLAPTWWSTPGYQLFKERYQWADTPYAQYETIARTLARHTDEPGFWERIFFEMMWWGWLSPSTPVLSNTGTNRGLPVSCSGGHVEDSILGFFDARRESAVLTKNGFGTSAYLGDIRPRGSLVGSGGKADGIVPVIKGFVQDSRDVKQGTNRRGAWAGYVPIEHGDFWELIRFLEKEPDDLNIGWNISDDFIQRLNNGDEDALLRYQEVLKVKMVTGKGYIWFIDKANRKLPDYYPIENKASNLCVAGDQRVVTDRGILTAFELYQQGGEMRLYDNTQTVSASPMELIERDAPTYKVTLANGMTHTVTSYHKIMTDQGCKEAINLRIGDKVAFQNSPGLFGGVQMEDEAFLLGLWQGDGTKWKDLYHTCLWESDFDLEGEVKERHDRICDKYQTQVGRGNNRVYKNPNFHEAVPSEGGVRKRVLVSKALGKAILPEKGVIPWWVWEGDEDTQWQYIRGLFYSDGTVNVTKGKGNPFHLSICNTDEDFLRDLQIILANLGVNTSLSVMREAGKTPLPDGNGGSALCDTKTVYRLVCGNKPDGLLFDRKTGFLTRKGILLDDREYRDNTKKYSKVVSIEFAGNQDVFCCTVDSEDHLWVCNGFITHNCSEILLPADKDHSFSCVLSSLNLAKYDEWQHTNTIYNSTVFLDCVVSEFLEKARDMPGLENVVRFTEKSRAIGLGVCGWHTLLQKKGIAFESLEAHMLNSTIFKEIHDRSQRASMDLAEIHGEPEWCKGRGVRNASRVAVAPTKSTALIMGGVSEGISPDPAMVFTQSTAGGEVFRINPVLLDLMKEKGVYSPRTVREVNDASGSVQGVDWLTEEEKLVFRTAFEIDQSVILRMASARALWIDQWQSLNLFFPVDEDPAYISEIHQQAFEDENIVGLYYVYSKTGVVGSIDRDECLACQ